MDADIRVRSSTDAWAALIGDAETRTSINPKMNAFILCLPGSVSSVVVRGPCCLRDLVGKLNVYDAKVGTLLQSLNIGAGAESGMAFSERLLVVPSGNNLIGLI